MTGRPKGGYRTADGERVPNAAEANVMDTVDKVRENAVRKRARWNGLVLVKSRAKDPEAPGYGRYGLRSQRYHGSYRTRTIYDPVGYEETYWIGPTGKPTGSLDQIEQFLHDDQRRAAERAFEKLAYWEALQKQMADREDA